MSDPPDDPGADDELLLDRYFEEKTGRKVDRQLTRGEVVDKQWSRVEPFAATIDLTVLLGIAKWVWLAVTGGVVGNLAYDLIKKAAGRSRPQSRPFADAELLLTELVLHAVLEQCHRYGMVTPAPDSLTVTAWNHGQESVTAVVESSKDLRAEVTIPYNRNPGTQVTVRLRDVAQRPAIAKAAWEHRKESGPSLHIRWRTAYLAALFVIVVLWFVLAYFLAG